MNEENDDAQIAQVDIGELLRSKRAESGASVRDVAGATKLNTNIIEKLEANQFSDIGTVVYVRGYLSLYAKHLGLDAAQVLSVYNVQHPAEQVAIRPSVGLAAGGRQKKTKRHSKTISFLVAATVLVGLVYAYLKLEPQFFNKDGALNINSGLSDEGSDIGSNDNLTDILQEAEIAQTRADDVLGDIPPSNELVTPIDLDVSLPPLVTDTSGQQSAPTINLESSDVDSAAVSEAPSDNTSAGEGASAETNTETTPESKSARFQVTFEDECWVKVTDADGKVLTSRVYNKGKKLDVKGASPLSVLVGVPRAVKSVKLDGKNIRLANYKTGNIKYEIK